MNLSFMQMMSGVSGGLASQPITKPPLISRGDDTAENGSNWGKCLEDILQSEFKDGTALEDDACGLYKIEITGIEGGINIYYIEMNTMSRCVKEEITPDQKPDISVKISSQDLSSVLDGSLPPLQAYLTGKIAVNGDVRKLMLFDKLSSQSHTPGTLFNV